MDSSQGHPGGGGWGKGRQIAWIYKGLHRLKALIGVDPDVCKAVPTVAQLGIVLAPTVCELRALICFFTVCEFIWLFHCDDIFRPPSRRS